MWSIFLVQEKDYHAYNYLRRYKIFRSRVRTCIVSNEETATGITCVFDGQWPRLGKLGSPWPRQPQATPPSYFCKSERESRIRNIATFTPPSVLVECLCPVFHLPPILPNDRLQELFEIMLYVYTVLLL